ncbi:MAG: molybdopterin-dependent oxidoreductase, partial [Isosphaeraceae bacterium]
LQLFGLVEKAVALNWSELQAQPYVKIFADMHCVTRWSMLDNTWEGVSTRHLASLAGIKPEARYVIAHGAHGFTTNMPLADFLDEDCLVAWSRNGEALDPDHGWPLRLVIPKLYAWKSAKWLLGLEFSATDEPGFWEQNGYHNHGDPWTEERFWD